MKKSLLLIAFFIIGYYNVTAQSEILGGKSIESFSGNNTFNTPDVTEFHRVNFLPVNLYTGRTDVSIPIFNIESGGIKLPISLSYNTGGIKVDQTASSVGLGWILNAGGSIIRIIKDLPDNKVKIVTCSEGNWDLGTLHSPIISSIGYNRLNTLNTPRWIASYVNGAAYFRIMHFYDIPFSEKPRDPADDGNGGTCPDYGPSLDLLPDTYKLHISNGFNTSFIVTRKSTELIKLKDAEFIAQPLDKKNIKIENPIMQSKPIKGLGFKNSSLLLGTIKRLDLFDFYTFKVKDEKGIEYTLVMKM